MATCTCVRVIHLIPLGRWLIQQRVHILLIAAINFVQWILCRKTLLRNIPKAILFWIPAILWTAYAAWE